MQCLLRHLQLSRVYEWVIVWWMDDLTLPYNFGVVTYDLNTMQFGYNDLLFNVHSWESIEGQSIISKY